MKLRRRFLGVSLVALFTAVGFGVWGLCQELPGQKRLLPDGSTLELRGVTFGRQHHFVDGSPLTRAFPLLSEWQQRRKSFLFRVPQDKLTSSALPVLWFRRWDPIQPHNIRSLDGSVARDVGVIDEHGCRIRCNDFAAWPVETPSGSALSFPYRPADALGAEVEVFPRRARAFRYALFQEDRRQPVAEFAAGNPVFARYPSWTPRPYPVRASAGGTEFVLTRLARARRERGPWDATRASFRYYKAGRPTRNWYPWRVVVKDATGNSLATTSAPTGPLSGVFDSLCARESAWKLVVAFARPRPAHAPADYLWSLRSVPVPRTGYAAITQAGCHKKDVTVQVRWLHGDGWVDYPDGTGGGSYLLPGLSLRVLNHGPPIQLSLLRLSDQLGSSVLPRVWDGTGWTHGEYFYDATRVCHTGETDCEFALRYPPSTRLLNLTFAVHRLRTVEFLAKPPAGN
jgi:hypothetical protein